MIAPPTFIAAIRTPTAGAAYVHKDYGVTKVTTCASMEWVDIMRVGDRLASELKVTGVEAGKSRNGQRLAYVQSQATYRNSYSGLIGTATCTSTMIPFRRGEAVISNREIYEYSDEEIASIEGGIEAEPPPQAAALLG